MTDHYDGCWREHLECALAEMGRKEGLLESWQVGYERLKDKQRNTVAALEAERTKSRSLKGEADMLRKRLQRATRGQIDSAAEALIDGLEVALGFYAEPKNWEHNDDAGGVPVALDKGHRARLGLDPQRAANRTESVDGMRRRLEGQKREINELREQRDAMQRWAEAAEMDAVLNGGLVAVER